MDAQNRRREKKPWRNGGKKVERGEYRCEGTVLAAFEDGIYKYTVPLMATF